MCIERYGESKKKTILPQRKQIKDIQITTATSNTNRIYILYIYRDERECV